ncbi:MAG: hypothetical protein ABIX01_11005 [Chitinophagaceae bacterium]
MHVSKQFFNKIITALICCLLAFSSCKPGKNIPDVSDIKVNVNLLRFEQDFFTMDTLNLNESLNQLSRKYPSFLGDFMGNILGLPQNDSALGAVKSFIRTYQPVYKATQKLYADFIPYKKEIEQGLRFTKYYFPNYKLPANIFTFIGPMDALFNGSTASYGDVMTVDGPAIGLQLHLGKDNDAYQTGMENGITYAYQVRRFTPETIGVNVIKNVVDDLYPYTASTRPLIEQMIEKGKRIYVLDLLMPYAGDTLKIGYSAAQLAICNEHEADIWNFFVKNSLVFSLEPEINKEYIDDGPKTQVLGEGVPGYLGLYVGWQIVKTWMVKNEKLSLDELMKKDPKALFNEAGYKPRSQ